MDTGVQADSCPAWPELLGLDFSTSVMEIMAPLETLCKAIKKKKKIKVWNKILRYGREPQNKILALENCGFLQNTYYKLGCIF